MKRISSGFVAILLGISACSREPPAPPPPEAPPFRPVADVKQLMASIIEPAADVYWDAVGSVTDKNGTVEMAPKTDEEWKAVANSAYGR